MKKLKKGEEGITLMILVVTIVVILILAAITVDLSFSDAGIIKSAQGLQNKIDYQIQTDEDRMNQLQQDIANGTIEGGSGLIPDANFIEGGGGDSGDNTNPPKAPNLEIVGTIGKENIYISEVEIKVMANDRADNLTYIIEGTGIEQGSIDTETSIGNGQSIRITKDGTYTVTVHAYNRNGQKSKEKQVVIVRDTGIPTATLELKNIEDTFASVQIVADDPEPSSGLAIEQPYTFYYKEDGTDNWVEDGKGATSSYTYTGLKEGTIYSLKAEVTDKAGNIGNSNEIENVQMKTMIKIEWTTEWSKPYIHEKEESSCTITITEPVKISDTVSPVLQPNTTGSHVKVEPVNPDENGYATEFTITVTGGVGNGEERVYIPSGTFVNKEENKVASATKEGITIDNTKPGILENVERKPEEK